MLNLLLFVAVHLPPQYTTRNDAIALEVRDAEGFAKVEWRLNNDPAFIAWRNGRGPSPYEGQFAPEMPVYHRKYGRVLAVVNEHGYSVAYREKIYD
jgi:hypothetical protein